MRSLSLFTSLFLLFCAVAAAQTPIDVQPIRELIPNGSLGTCGYTPVEREQPFFKKLDKSEVATGSFMAPYSIHGKQGKYVSWYGIVRGITATGPQQNQLTLLLEHKYFDGMTDCHIMLVSQSGGGDFRATLDSFPAALPALALVRIYGKVVEEKDKTPLIAAEYVRVWPWLTFTLTDLGAGDESNPTWAKFSHLRPGERIYRPYPNEAYYQRILGDANKFGLNWKQQ